MQPATVQGGNVDLEVSHVVKPNQTGPFSGRAICDRLSRLPAELSKLEGLRGSSKVWEEGNKKKKQQVPRGKWARTPNKACLARPLAADIRSYQMIKII
jgi:hypothetical protein